MAQMKAQTTAQLFLAALLIYSNSAKPSPFFTEDRNTGELTEEPTPGLQSETEGTEQQLTELPIYCDTQSLTIGVSPSRYTFIYLLRDDETGFSLSQLMNECSHVELQSASLIRIFYRSCSLLDWLAQEKQFTLKLGSSHLNQDTVQTQTCPSASSAPLQLPDLKCEGANMTVTLAAKELREARFINRDASSLQETLMIEGDGLTQWTDGGNLVVQVENPMIEDMSVLLLQFTEISDTPNMMMVFCPQRHPKLQRGTQTKNIYNYFSTHDALAASESTILPFIQWAMPVFMTEEYRPYTSRIQSTQHTATTIGLPGGGLVAKTTEQQVGEQITAESPPESEGGHQAGPILILTSTENLPAAATATAAATSTGASMKDQSAKSTAALAATAQATKTFTEPGTSSSTKKKPYTSSVEMKTTPVDSHATANPTTVTLTSTGSFTAAHKETKTTANNTNTEAKTRSAMPTTTTNPSAWTPAPETSRNQPSSSSTPSAASPTTSTVSDVDCVATAGTTSKTSTVERTTDFLTRTTTVFQNISTKLSTTAPGPSTTKRGPPVSPGSVTPPTISGVSALATATQTSASATTSSMTAAAVPETTTSGPSASTVLNPTAALRETTTIRSPTVTLTSSANVLNNEATTGTQTATSALHCVTPGGAQTAVAVVEASPDVEQGPTPSGESTGAATPDAAPSPTKTTVEKQTTEATLSSTTAAPFTQTLLPGITIEAKGSTTASANLDAATTVSASTVVKTSTTSITRPAGNHTDPSVFDCITATSTPGAEDSSTTRATTSAAATTASTPQTPAGGEEDSPASSSTKAPLLNTTTAAGQSTPVNIWTAALQQTESAPVLPAAAGGEVPVPTTVTPDAVSELYNVKTDTMQTGRKEEQEVINPPYDIILGSSDATKTTPHTTTTETTSYCNDEIVLHSGQILTTTEISTQTSVTSRASSTTLLTPPSTTPLRPPTTPPSSPPTTPPTTRTSIEPATLNC